MQELPIVVIVTENGPVRINESDYDPAIHTLAGGQEVAPMPETPVVETPVVETPVVKPNVGIVKDGSKYFLVDMNKDNERIGDPKGYTSNAKATAAAQGLMV